MTRRVNEIDEKFGHLLLGMGMVGFVDEGDGRRFHGDGALLLIFTTVKISHFTRQT